MNPNEYERKAKCFAACMKSEMDVQSDNFRNVLKSHMIN